MMTKNILGKVLILFAVLIAIACFLIPSIFIPDGDLYEPYVLSRNLLILSMINWCFFLGVKLLGNQE